MNSKPYDIDGFVGDFRELLIQFVQMKRSLGFDYYAEANALKRFSEFTLQYTIENHTLTKELADAWTEKRPNERDVTWERRINNLKRFALFLNNLGHDAYVPSCKAKINRHSYMPYIFSKDLIRNLLTECDNIKPHPLSNRHLVFPAVYRLLYGCGVRISEAVKLRLKDVDLKQGIVVVRGSKFNKDRVIPMSASLTRYLVGYSLKIHTVSSPQDYFFMKRDRTAYSSNTVYRNFRRLLQKSGISHGGKGRGPRLHDLRHTFAVHSLKQMVQQGVELYCALPILSTYLGHASIKATEQYVRLTAEAYPEILDTVSQTCAYIFPEVKII
ncbi:MAG: tyrosine-type recombinase/integrase [Syntrophomonadaceae bacterium]